MKKILFFKGDHISRNADSISSWIITHEAFFELKPIRGKRIAKIVQWVYFVHELEDGQNTHKQRYGEGYMTDEIHEDEKTVNDFSAWVLEGD